MGRQKSFVNFESDEEEENKLWSGRVKERKLKRTVGHDSDLGHVPLREI